MKTVLVSAPSFFSPGRPAPSLALAVLASSLKSRNIECECIDCNFLPGFYADGLQREGEIFERRILNQCIELLIQRQPDVVAISAWGVSVPFAIVFSRAVRQYFPHVSIIAGGIQDVFLATKLMGHADQIDATVVGEGEYVIVEILERIAEARDLCGVKGVVHRVNGEIHSESPREPLPAHRWPKPDLSSFVLPFGKRLLQVEGSRGCSYRCTFCSVNRGTLRRKSPQALAREVVELQETQDPELVLLCDNFVPLRGRWTETFCDELSQLEPKARWTCSSRADRMSSLTIQKMASVGCQRIFLGVESTSVDTLRYINKTPSAPKYLFDLMDNIHTIGDCGIGLKVSTIVGFPCEGVGDMQRTIEFVLRLTEMGIDAYTGPVVVYPGSQLWNMYENQQIKLRKISNPRILRNSAGLFSSQFDEIPYLVPNNFLPEHEFLRQEDVESIIAEGLSLASRFRQRKPRIVGRGGEQDRRQNPLQRMVRI